MTAIRRHKAAPAGTICITDHMHSYIPQLRHELVCLLERYDTKNGQCEEEEQLKLLGCTGGDKPEEEAQGAA